MFHRVNSLLHFIGIVPLDCSNIGLPKKCVELFTKRKPAGDTHSKELKICEKWTTENKENKMLKKCNSVGNR